MNSRERMTAALEFRPVDRLPRDLWILPAAEKKYEDDFKRILEQYPKDLGGSDYRPPRAKRQQGNPVRDLYYVDEWGSGWKAKQWGIAGEVVDPPIKSWSDLDTYSPPYELIGKGMENVNRSCAESDLFILGGCCPRPFERMQFLRGSEQLYMDLGYGESGVYRLRDMVQEYYMTELETWCKTDVDAVWFMDDWGSQSSLLISPKLWREFYKPLYKDYCDMAKSHGKFILMHSDGFIESIYPDLVELGVNAVNSQLFCMNIERLATEFGGKIVFWGEIDRQGILPRGNEDEVRAAVQRLVDATSHFDGGLIAQCEWGSDVSPQTIEWVYDEFLKYGPKRQSGGEKIA